MKKTVFVFAMLLTLLLTLTACGSPQPADSPPNNAPAANSQNPNGALSSDPVGQPDDPVDQPNNPDDSPGGSSGPLDLFQNYVSIDGYTHIPANPLRVKENVLVDEAGIIIKALWVDPDPAKLAVDQTEFGPQLEILVINNSGKNIAIWVDNATVNGYMVHAPFCEYIYGCDGMELQYTVPFNCADLLESCLTDIAEVGLKFSIYDLDDYEDPFLTTDMVYVETELASNWTDSVYTDGALIYEDADFTIKVLGPVTKIIEYNSGNYHNPQVTVVESEGLLIYLENRTESPVWFEVWSSAINGIPTNLYLPDECKMLLPNSKTITNGHLHFQDIEELGYISIYDATLSFGIFSCQGKEPDIWTDELLLTTEKVEIVFYGN